jgi:hypothetical protein
MPAVMRFLHALPDRRVLADVQAAVDWLRARPEVAGRKVGVTGFCMGGKYAFLAAARCTGIAAAVPWYGMLRADALDEAIRAAGLDPLATVPRSSSQLGIPSGPHALPTPLPGSLFMTPPPYGTATPSPYHGMGSAPTQSLDHIPQTRMTSIAEIHEPLSKNMKTAAIVIVLVALAGAAYFMFFHSSSKKTETKTSIVTVPVAVDKATRLKAALHDLENGKTCADRKAAIPTIVQVGDPDAIPVLKKARHRMRGGVLGIGDSNTNACLKADAEAAVTALGGTLR